MFSILKSEDVKVVANSRFVKNATFYKDMLAFFDAFESLTTTYKDKLPNFCFEKKNVFCLEGLCLAMRMFATELGFETLHLSADYMRVLYYTLASYSKDKSVVEKEVIEREFEEYKKASKQIAKTSKEAVAEVENNYLSKKAKHDQTANKYAKNLVLSHVFNILTIVCLISGVFVAGVFMAFYSLEMLELKSAALIAGTMFVAFEMSAILFKVLHKHNYENSNDNAYILQNMKKAKDEAFKIFKTEQDKANRILSEKYEFEHTFDSSMQSLYAKLDMSDIVNRLAEYKLLSYNIVHDVRKLFENQQKQVDKIVHNILSLSKHASNDDFVEIYKAIQNQDWLYYNPEVRYSFIRKFIDVNEKKHVWELLDKGCHIQPFGINTKALAKEEIVYLKSKDSLFVSSSLDKFLNTKYAKNLNALELKASINAEALKAVKTQYINHFYNYENVKDYDNLFYTTKVIDGVRVTDDILLENEKIPTYIQLKIKLLENNMGLGNSTSFVVKQIIQDIGSVAIEQDENAEIINEADIVYPIYECDKVIEVNNYTVNYVTGERVVTGYRPFEA